MNAFPNGKRRRAILLEAVSSGIQAESDKVSLPEQDARLHEIGEREHWDIIDIILIPGFSRVYYNYPEFAQAALNDGIPAPMRMFEHWKKRDFDVFACVDGSRFGREQSIFAEVVSRTIDIGGMVFTVKDGYIHKGNYRMYISMGGYSAAGEIDELMRRKAFGMRGRAQKGLPTAPKLVPFLKFILDDKGKQLGTEVNEDLRRLWNDLAEAILEGVPWNQMEKVLYERYGHVRPDGRRWRTNAMYDMVMNPAFWGDDAINHQFRDDVRTKHHAPWIWDDSQSAPEGVQLFRGRHPAVYTGELAERIKAELWRRHTVIKGRASPNSYKFTGLLVCDECRSALSAHKKPDNRWIGYRCMSHFASVGRITVCTQRRMVSDAQAQQYLIEEFEAYFAGKGGSLFSADPPDKRSVADDLARIEAELEARSAEHAEMRRELIRAREQDKAGWRADLEALSDDIAVLEQRAQALQFTDLASQHEHAESREQLEEIRDLTPSKFFEQSPRAINQKLHRALGTRRLVVRDGEIQGHIRVQRKR